MFLNKEQLERYGRQIMLPEVGVKGQEKLLKARVLIIGAGGLGSPCALYLAAAGVGTIAIADSDNVELKNLHRQIIHSTKTIGHAKTDSARQSLEQLNKDVKVITYNFRITSDNILDIVKKYDIILDCTDNFAAKYLINDSCVKLRRPLVHGSVFGFEGQALVVRPFKSACYRCIYPIPPRGNEMPQAQDNGILGTVPGVIGTIQANEALKYIMDIGDIQGNSLLIFDALNSSFRKIKAARSKGCRICGKFKK